MTQLAQDRHRLFPAAPLILGLLLAVACSRDRAPKMSEEDIMVEFYTAQLETLRALDQAFYRIGQEYYTLEIEYDRMGRQELAEATRLKAVQFHQQHQEFQKRATELEERLARYRRGEPPRMVSPVAAPAVTPTPLPTVPPVYAPRTLAPTPAPTLGAPSFLPASPPREPSAQPTATPLPVATPRPTPAPFPPAPPPGDSF